jgi:hypothetical protein
VNDLGTSRTDVAYVLISHGPTGLGAYPAHVVPSVRRDMPTESDEIKNTSAIGPFVIKAFVVRDPNDPTFVPFDDYLSYRRVEDLVRAAGQYARDWPEAAPSAATFNKTNVSAALGGSVTSGQDGVGQVSVSFTGVVASGFANGSATQIAFEEASDQSWAGIGVAGGGSALIQSSANESLRLEVERGATKFAATLTNFGTYGTYYEIVQFRFLNGGTEVAGSPRYGIACNVDGEGTLASFTVDVGSAFDRVDITPVPALDASMLPTIALTGITALLVSEISACLPASATCTTSLALPGNTCPVF